MDGFASRGKNQKLASTLWFESPSAKSPTRTSSASGSRSESLTGKDHFASGRVVPVPAKLESTVKMVFQAESSALLQMLKTLEMEAFEMAISALVQAKRVYCCGFGESGFLASEAEYCFARQGIDCLAVCNPMQMAVQSTRLSLRDTLVVFSRTEQNHRLAEVLLLARRAGATTIGVTTRSASPLTDLSDISLLLLEPNITSLAFSTISAVGQLTLVEAMASCVALYRTQRPIQTRPADEDIKKW